jgi:integrase
MTAIASARITGVREFVESEYLPHVSSTLAKSTVDGYKKMWAAYGSYFENWELEMRTCDCQAIMRQISTDKPELNKTTLGHVKNFFSGIWAHALRMGSCDRENPWRAVQIPNAPEPTDTHAYSSEEIEAMLLKVNGTAKMVILLAACTGLRKSEIRGLRWSDFDTETSTLSVNRAVWRTHVKSTKSKASKAPVPVVPMLAAKLAEYQTTLPKKQTLIFASSDNTPLDLDNLARRVIIPALEGHVEWRGWHAFRRGLATFLHAKGVPDKEIQAVLRHENVSITQRSYVKTVAENVRAAMAEVTFGNKS